MTKGVSVCLLWSNCGMMRTSGSSVHCFGFGDWMWPTLVRLIQIDRWEHNLMWTLPLTIHVSLANNDRGPAKLSNNGVCVSTRVCVEANIPKELDIKHVARYNYTILTLQKCVMYACLIVSVTFISVANNCSKHSNEIIVFLGTLQIIQKTKFFKH